MKWEQHKYYLRSGDIYISKVYVNGKAWYTLWERPYVRHGTWDSVDEAKREAGRLGGAS